MSPPHPSEDPTVPLTPVTPLAGNENSSPSPYERLYSGDDRTLFILFTGLMLCHFSLLYILDHNDRLKRIADRKQVLERAEDRTMVQSAIHLSTAFKHPTGAGKMSYAVKGTLCFNICVSCSLMVIIGRQL